MPNLIALAGPSRSGKGTCAIVISEVCKELGLTFRERQLSGPGKQYVASAWNPDITEEEAIAWFDELKMSTEVHVSIVSSGSTFMLERHAEVPLQQYLQRMLQGARDRWGTDFWTDKVLPEWMVSVPDGTRQPQWWYGPFDSADVCVISDLRQENEAKRVCGLRGIVVEIVRPVVDDAYVTGSGHITEQRLPGNLVDHILFNDSSIEDLRARARDLFTDLLTKETPAP